MASYNNLGVEAGRFLQDFGMQMYRDKRDEELYRRRRAEQLADEEAAFQRDLERDRKYKPRQERVVDRTDEEGRPYRSVQQWNIGDDGGKFEEVARLPVMAKAPQTRERKEGDKIVTEEYDPINARWVKVSEAGRYRPGGEGGGRPYTINVGDEAVTIDPSTNRPLRVSVGGEEREAVGPRFKPQGAGTGGRAYSYIRKDAARTVDDLGPEGQMEAASVYGITPTGKDKRGNPRLTFAERQKLVDALAQEEAQASGVALPSARTGRPVMAAPEQPKPSVPSGPPKPGTVEDGYRFKGGDPADPNNWEKVR